jgi:hypothetical protein
MVIGKAEIRQVFLLAVPYSLLMVAGSHSLHLQYVVLRVDTPQRLVTSLLGYLDQSAQCLKKGG